MAGTAALNVGKAALFCMEEVTDITDILQMIKILDCVLKTHVVLSPNNKHVKFEAIK